MAKSCVHVYVSGVVQGVAFRYTARRQAQRLGVGGWVKNLPDGRVELVIEGEDSAVRQMVGWCRQGPRSADVSDIQEEPCTYSGRYTAFDVRF
ncbi:acylphosphatase [candidate division KSB3 bacterium]|uniref:Acylphosphatase n=1 Tax=candidate division KSB3 bacterium TaxID=2044937 RepID=A0A9D5Q4E0_9BACT|nr:acylphosphatase [candidate division KSB3 bacterium]MBD3323460.1 acylphosphatase [candidate division KSB3 bacterium]